MVLETGGNRGGLSRARQLQWLPDSCLPAESAPTCIWTGIGAAIPGRDRTFTEPSLGDIAVGIAFHQWANFCCAMVFFEVVGQLIANRGPLGWPCLWCLRLYTAGRWRAAPPPPLSGTQKTRIYGKSHDPSRFSRLD
jgi:hypothetical protein